jgi:tetratricopeptide (TPR) repeat protein
MLRLRATGYCAVLFLLMSCLGGCVQGNNHMAEEKDPHFQRGCDLVSSQDFKRAADEFEKALETNPHSAAAHYELGCLYDTKLNDDAAAIYHYEQHLRLRPDSARAALVKDRIRGCKQDLANSEFRLPNTRNLQREIDRLNTENLLLKQQLTALKIQPAPVAPVAPVAAIAQSRAEPVPFAPLAPAHPRVHIVKAHETIVSIAAACGVKASAVLAANPQTDPRRLRIGQSLNLP